MISKLTHSTLKRRTKLSKIVWIEGPDNCGKTTLVSELQKMFGDQCEVVKQPSSTAFGSVIYSLHHDYQGVKVNMFSRQLLHVAAHVEYYKENTNPQSKVILNDRSFLSTIAYHTAFNEKNTNLQKEIDLILEIEMHFLHRSLRPDIIIFLMNEPFENSKKELEDYGKLREAYSEVLGISKELFPRARHYGHRVQEGKTKESAEELFRIIKD